jgi:hypothetical protein
MNVFARRVIVGLALTICSGVAAQDHRVVRLASGDEVKILSVGELNFANDKPAWWLRYETHIAMHRTKELEAEAMEVWNIFRPEADRSGKINAAVSAVESDVSVDSADQYNIVFQKESDGTWKMR